MPDVATLSRRLDEQKERRARAQGTIDNIKAQWKADFGVDSPDEIEKIKAQTESELDALQKEYDEQMAINQKFQRMYVQEKRKKEYREAAAQYDC
jgi:hypothetical protein